MKINNLIIHRIISEQYSAVVTTQARKAENQLPNQNADNLLSSVDSSFQNDRNIAYAGFNEEAWFPTNLTKVLNNNLSFVDFSLNGLDMLKEYMKLVPAATGGYLAILNYKDDANVQNWMVILLKDRDGIGINEFLDLEPIQSLDLDKLHFAAKINIQKWSNSRLKQKINHISFLKGKNRETVVKYFLQFLGIDETSFFDPQIYNEDLVVAIKSYSHVNYEPDEAQNVFRRVHDLAERKNQRDENLSLTEISNLVDPEDPDNFIRFLNQTQIEIPGEIPVIMNEINKINKFKFQTKDLYLSFHRRAIEDHAIWINNAGNLEIKNVPDDIKREFPSYKNE